MAKKFQPAQSVERQWKVYLEQLEQTGTKLPEYEALRPFMGKRGRVLKSKTRSKKAREAYTQAQKRVQSQHGNRLGAKGMQAAMTARAKANAEKTARGSFTHAVNEAKKKLGQIKTREQKQEEAQKKQKQKTKRQKQKPDSEKSERKKPEPEAARPSMKEAAKKALEEAQEALRKAQADYDYAEMVEEFNKGAEIGLSAKVIYEIRKTMEAQGFSQEDINKLINKVISSYQDIPDEAKELFKEDDFGNVIVEFISMSEVEQEDFSAMIGSYLTVDEEDRENVLDAIRYWQENGQNTMGFSQFWEELQSYNDIGERSNWEEILGEDQED